MIVARSIDELAGTICQSCVTIGNFDGVHLGHQRLISTVRTKAQSRGLTSVVMTFEPHPLQVLIGEKAPPFITSLDKKLSIIASLDVQITLVLPFTRALAALDPEEFVRAYLVEGLHASDVIIGYDYSFGKGRKGNFELLSTLGARYGYTVERLDPVIIDGAVVSSTRIRDLVQAGKVWEARPLLGRFYQVSGSVIHGRKRGGRLLGFPTANLLLTDALFPKTGVYAVWAELDGRTIQGVANIGYNPTFGDTGLSVEVHLLDFAENIYGRQLSLHLVQRIRSEKRFDSLEELMARIREDVELGRRILAAPEAQPAPLSHPPVAEPIKPRP